MTKDIYEITKKEKIYIHAGFHKTGTTTVQYSLDNKRIFKDFHYLDLGNPIHSWAISCVVGARKKHPYEFIIENEDGTHLFETFNKHETIKLLKNFTISPKEKHVISGEDIARFSIEELTKLKNFFELLYKNIEIIIYVRPPFSYIVSSYQEMIKSGTIPPDISERYLNYDAYIKNLDHVFGRDNVKIYRFDRDSLVDGDILADFLYRIGASGASVDNVSANTSLSKEAFSVLYVYAKFNVRMGGAAKGFRNDDLLAELNKLGNTKFSLDYKLIERTLQESKPSLQWVESRANISLDESITNNPSAFSSEEDILQYALTVYPKLEEIVNDQQTLAQDNTHEPRETYMRIVNLVEKLYEKYQ